MVLVARHREKRMLTLFPVSGVLQRDRKFHYEYK